MKGMEIILLPGNNFVVNENLARKYGYELSAFLGYLMSVDEANNGIKHNLPGNNFYANENISSKYGLDVAVLLGYLMFVDKTSEHIDDKLWFCQTLEEIEKRIGMKRRKQEKALKILEKLGIIEKKVMGIPAKRYFKINYEKANEVVLNIQEKERE
jgi:hypothetical protein